MPADLDQAGLVDATGRRNAMTARLVSLYLRNRLATAKGTDVVPPIAVTQGTVTVLCNQSGFQGLRISTSVPLAISGFETRRIVVAYSAETL